MTDVYDADAALFETAHDVEQARDIGFSQRSGGLIHYENARVIRKGAEDFNALTMTNRQRSYDLVRREIVNIERGEQYVGASSHRAPVDSTTCAAWRMPKKDIFGDCQFGEEQQFLIDRGDPGVTGVVGRGKDSFPPVNKDLAESG